MKKEVSRLLVLIFSCSLVTANNQRQKRLLHFPDKTNVVITMSLLKLFPSDSIVNTLTEYDVLFPVPLHPYKVHARLKRAVDRTVIHNKIKTIANTLGFTGERCLKTMFCAIKLTTMRKEMNEADNFIVEILGIIFDSPANMECEKCLAILSDQHSCSKN